MQQNCASNVNKQGRMYFGPGTVAHTASQWCHTRMVG